MAVGTLGGLPFDLDPESIAYNFAVKTSEINTVGGKVVQVYGSRLSDVMVSGSFGSGGQIAQQAFLAQVTKQIQGQIGPIAPSNGQGYQNGPPINFSFSPLNIDLTVYILDYMQTGSTSSVLLDNEIINPGWTLQLFVVNDNSSLAQTTNTGLLGFLNHITEGLGWTPNQFNGPVLTPTQAGVASGAATTAATAAANAVGTGAVNQGLTSSVNLNPTGV